MKINLAVTRLAVWFGVAVVILTGAIQGHAQPTAPTITNQPASQTNFTGATASFSVTAVGTAPLHYQWWKGAAKLVKNTRISVVNSNVLTIKNLVNTDAGNYFVVVSNSVGKTTSSNAVLTLLAPDITKPKLTITNLTAGQRFTNDVAFTVQGTAQDNAGVTNVLWSLNSGAWLVATNDNNWTNWSATISMIPGTNTFSAYAVDISGNHSVTNTVKFIFVVFDVLTVRTNGPGTIKPSYNGVLLQDGVNYSMTGTSTKLGVGVSAWLDGNTNVVGRGSTLTFMMASNLTLIANFAETTPPKVNVSNAVTNSDGVPNHYVIYGVASDNVAVSQVFYQLNNTAWTLATTTNNWANWAANVALLPGGNTFSVYSEDTNYNVSTTLTVQIAYNSAPAKLSGQGALATVAGTHNIAPFNLAFGTSTFSQFVQDTNNVNGVGTYTYSPSGAGATLKLKYTGPPSATNAGSQTLNLTFFTPALAYYTNTTTKFTGYLQFLSISNLALTNLSGQLIWALGSQGDGDGLLFQKKNYLSQSLLTTATNAGTYIYTQYSRLGGLIKFTSTNGTSYLLADFAATNYGTYHSEDYDRSGHTNGTDTGRFFVQTQMPGGNAPLTVTNSIFQIYSVGGTFFEQFGTDTFSQDTISTNYDNDVGSYTYTCPNTNIGQLNLTVTEPPTLAGTTNAARLIFIGGNIGLFTNDDGTVSSFVVTTATNLVPDSITNIALLIGFYNVNDATIQFTNDGSFVYTVYNNPYIPNSYFGTYTYTPFSPGAAMVQLTYLDTSNNVAGRDWLQFNFKSTNTGNAYWSQFDTSTNYVDVYYSGPFKLY